MFDIQFSESALRQLRAFAVRDQRIIVAAIDDQLSHQPTLPTRNRKQLRANPLAAWELRVGQFRVLYNVDEDQEIVFIVVIAIKVGNRFIIEGEEYPL